MRNAGSASTPTWKRGLRLAASRRIAGNALRICLVVGTILNLINHGPTLLSGRLPGLAHLLLNFLVPYAVATYSAVRLHLQQDEAARRPAAAGTDRSP